MKNFDRREFLKLAGAASLGTAVVESAQPASRVGRATPGEAASDPWLEIDRKNVAWNLAQGRRWPTIALVTSNHATIDVTGAERIKIGAEAVIFGKQGENEISAEELAAWAGVSAYKILIGMNPLLPRVYLE